MSDGLPVLHTLHLPPISDRVLGEVLKGRAVFATVSESCRRAWANAGAAQVSVIRNGVPVFTVDEVPIREDALLAGRLSPEKGFEDGIAAARAIGLRPVVVGVPYDQSYQLNLEAASSLRPQRGPRCGGPRMGRGVTWLLGPATGPLGYVYPQRQLPRCAPP